MPRTAYRALRALCERGFVYRIEADPPLRAELQRLPPRQPRPRGAGHQQPRPHDHGAAGEGSERDDPPRGARRRRSALLRRGRRRAAGLADARRDGGCACVRCRQGADRLAVARRHRIALSRPQHARLFRAHHPQRADAAGRTRRGARARLGGQRRRRLCARTTAGSPRPVSTPTAMCGFRSRSPRPANGCRRAATRPACRNCSRLRARCRTRSACSARTGRRSASPTTPSVAASYYAPPRHEQVQPRRPRGRRAWGDDAGVVGWKAGATVPREARLCVIASEAKQSAARRQARKNNAEITAG